MGWVEYSVQEAPVSHIPAGPTWRIDQGGVGVQRQVTPWFPVPRDRETLGQKAQILQANLSSPSHTG